MARNEQEREDLLAEARALVERCELCSPAFEDDVVLGFRRDGCASFYFGQLRAYHFNTHRQLRRAFDNGQLLKAERGRLISLVRHRTQHEVELVRHELNAIESRAFLDRAWRDLQTLATALGDETRHVLGGVPADVDVVGRAAEWLAQLKQPIAVAAGPEVR